VNDRLVAISISNELTISRHFTISCVEVNPIVTAGTAVYIIARKTGMKKFYVRDKSGISDGSIVSFLHKESQSLTWL